MFKKLAGLIFFGSIFLSICSVAMCIETSVVLHLSLNSLSFYLFVFGATLAQYNLHYLVKKNAVKNSYRLSWSLKNKNVHKILIGIGLIFVIVSLFDFQPYQFLSLLVFGIIALLYSFPFLPFTKKRIKDFGLLKIITLALVWTLVTVWLPTDKGGFNGLFFQLIFIRRFIFIFALCLFFDIRDIEIDRDKNISTLPVILGKSRSYLLIYFCLIIFISLSFMHYMRYPDAAQLLAMLISAVATMVLIEISKKNNSDFVYLAGVDGMMLLQAVLVIFTSNYNGH